MVSPEQVAFLDSVTIVLGAAMDFAARLADRCEAEAARAERGAVRPSQGTPVLCLP